MNKEQSQQPARQVRDLYISCGTYRDAAALVDDIEEALKREGIPAAVLGYGTTSKPHAGFIVMECYQPLPASVLDMLKTDPTIADYVTYDVPSIDQEQQAIQQWLLQQAATASRIQGYHDQHDSDLPMPPKPPDEYVLLSIRVPLLGFYDERWIARALGPEGVGVLVFEDQKKVFFLTSDEAIATLSVLQEEALHFLPHTTYPPLSERHRQQVAEIRAAALDQTRQQGGRSNEQH